MTLCLLNKILILLKISLTKKKKAQSEGYLPFKEKSSFTNTNPNLYINLTLTQNDIFYIVNCFFSKKRFHVTYKNKEKFIKP